MTSQQKVIIVNTIFPKILPEFDNLLKLEDVESLDLMMSVISELFKDLTKMEEGLAMTISEQIVNTLITKMANCLKLQAKLKAELKKQYAEETMDEEMKQKFDEEYEEIDCLLGGNSYFNKFFRCYGTVWTNLEAL